MEIRGTLEIDEQRGIIYFHHHDDNFTAYLENRQLDPVVTVLRICNLPKKPLEKSNGYIDITHMHGVNYDK